MKYGAIYPSLKGRTVLVTGGGSGIGAAIVTRLAEQGAKVGFLDIAAKPSKALVRKLSRKGATVHFELCDLTDIDALKQAVKAVRKALGPITVLVNNAAHDDRHTLEEVTPEYFDDRIAVNFKHQFFAIQQVVPDMKKARRGSIINMSSGSWMVGYDGLPVYAAAKAAVYGLTRGLARSLGPHNIRVNSVAPGWILTERQLKLWWTAEAEADVQKSQCLKRRLVGDDIARWVAFLAADDSDAMTNQNIVVDGGWL